MQFLLHPSVFIHELLVAGSICFEAINSRLELRHNLISQIVPLVFVLLYIVTHGIKKVLVVLMGLALLL